MYNITKTILSLVFLLVCVPEAHAILKQTAVQKGYAQYEKENFDGALEEFQQALLENQESDIINYNAGAAHYKKENYTDAVKHLQKALLSEDVGLRQKSHYNLGNSLFRLGLSKEEESLEFAIASLEKSLDQYTEAIKLDEQDDDAKFNYEYVKNELERLKQEQEQQEEQEQQQQPGEGESQDQQQGEGEDQKQDQKQDQQQGGDGEEQEQQQGENGEQQGNQGQDGQQQEQQNQEGQQDGQEAQDGEQGQEQDEGEGQQSQGQEQGEDEQQEGSGAQGEEGDQTQEPAVSSVGEANPFELTEEEAQMFLQGYEQGEQPKGLFNFQRKGARVAPVLRDW